MNYGIYIYIYIYILQNKPLEIKHFLKSKLVTKWALFLRAYTIFCMREAVYMSYGSRILPSPLGL